jgi:hypothetical protein
MALGLPAASLHLAGFDRRTEKNKDDHLSKKQRSSWFNP